MLVAAVAALAVFLVAVGANSLRIGELWGVGWGVFGAMIGYVLARALILESRIVKDACETSASVVRVWRPVWGRRGRMIEYDFLAQDGRRYMGTSAAPYPTPHVGHEFCVVYRRNRPTDSLPKRQFWFHEL